MSSVLVTGATGFIGQHLVASLKQYNHIQTRAAVRGTSSLPVETTLIDQIDQDTNWTHALKDIHTVIHLAARAHILQENTLDPETEFFTVNTQGTINLVNQAIEAKVQRFIFISSIGAMATLSEQTLTESSHCTPDTPYGRSKLQAEQALKQLCANSPMTWTILRPPLIYGPRNPGNMARLLKLVKTGLPLPLGAINNRRSLLYVGNLVDAIITCLNHANAKNQTFLISDGENLSTPDLIRQIGQAIGKTPLLLPVPPRLLTSLAQPLGKQETVNRLIGSLAIDSQKIRTTLNWTPPTTVSQGLQDTVNWYLNQ